MTTRGSHHFQHFKDKCTNGVKYGNIYVYIEECRAHELNKALLYDSLSWKIQNTVPENVGHKK